jgi:ADP-ribose pyrophosphatase YjhB (NUDIX family)
MQVRVRPTGILVEDNRILLIKQQVTDSRSWSLPGGKLESKEDIQQCLVREMKEETGLNVIVKELAYITDRIITPTIHIVHMSFLVTRKGPRNAALEWTHEDVETSPTHAKLRECKMIPVEDLTRYGFSPTFQQLVIAGFPGRGSYKGDYATLYGESGDGR